MESMFFEGLAPIAVQFGSVLSVSNPDAGPSKKPQEGRVMVTCCTIGTCFRF